jgi:hypothetical protein
LTTGFLPLRQYFSSNIVFLKLPQLSGLLGVKSLDGKSSALRDSGRKRLVCAFPDVEIGQLL